MKYEIVAAAGLDEARKAYEAGRCDVLTADCLGAARRAA